MRVLALSLLLAACSDPTSSGAATDAADVETRVDTGFAEPVESTEPAEPFDCEVPAHWECFDLFCDDLQVADLCGELQLLVGLESLTRSTSNRAYETILFSWDVVYLLDDIADGDPLVAPAGLAFDGAAWVNDSGAMRIDVVWGDGFETSEGTPIAHDLFDIDSYLVGAVRTVDGHEAVIAYDTTGPLVELLGFGVEPPNPLRVSMRDHAVGRLGDLDLQVTLTVDETRSGVALTDTLTTPWRRVGESSSTPLPFDSDGTVATAGAYTATTAPWRVQTIEDYGGPVWSGRIDVTTTGPEREMSAEILYSASLLTSTFVTLRYRVDQPG